MRSLFCFMALAFSVVGHSATDSFGTKANFAVNDTTLSLSTAVATIEARSNAPGYSWVKIHFYSFPPATDDLVSIANGDVGSMDKKWTKLADKHDNTYNTSNAVVMLTVDKNFNVWQVDMSVPGHSCTIAPFEQDVSRFLQDYRFDGRTLRLKSKGSFVCEMSSVKIQNQRFNWDINIESRVFAKK